LPDVVIFILIGILLGPAALSWIHVEAGTTANQLVLLFGASFIIFHGGMVTSFAVLKHVWRTVTLLSTLGVVVTAMVVGAASMWIFHIPFLPALLIGAIIASTDPAALVPLFQKYPIRKKVAETVISESAFTDATGAIMTTVVLGLLSAQAAMTWYDIGWQFIRLSIGGIAVGLVIGLIAAFLVSENDRGLLREFTPMVVVITVLAAYLVSEEIGASGFMAVFVAGVTVGNARSFRLTILPKEEHAAHQFIDAVGLKLRMLIFILLGSQVDFAALKTYLLPGLAVALIFIFVARPLTVLSSLLPDVVARWTGREVAFFFWTRETGVIAAALAGIVAGQGLAEGKLISSVVFLAILITLIVQAGTTPFVARKLGLMESPASRTQQTKNGRET
jgi:cell volume regulation protein A